MSMLLGLLERAVRSSGNRTALEIAAPGGVRELSFREIDARARGTAAALRARGLRSGDRLAVQLANGLAYLDLWLASLKLGAVFVPVNVLYRERELAHIVADAEPTAVVTTVERARLLPAGTVAWDVETLAPGAPDAAGEAPDDDETPVGDEAPAAIVYTSGTTGRAKGAVVTHGNLAANAVTLVEAWRITAEDRYLGVLPLFHVHGLANGVGCWLASGCRMRLVERFDHHAARAWLEEFRPTLFFGVPTIYVRLLELPDEAARVIGSRARLFVSGSAPLPASVFDAFRARFGHAILERYGMSETLMTLGNPYDGERRAGSVGLPFASVSTRIVDRSLRDVAGDETGELLVRGPSVFSGYWRQPEATRAAFADGWFRTGDLASREADGYVTLRGRASELILCAGFNVYPREIEELLLEQPGVREVAVVGVPDALRGERPLAFYVGEAEASALEAACRGQLASFKVPAAFVRLDALPRNALGKVVKAELRALRR